MTVKPIRIAIIEPNGADVHWFSQTAKEIGLPIELIHCSTGINALSEWAKGTDPAPDLIVVAALLPMLTLREFIDAARSVYPGVPIVVVGEQASLAVQIDGVDWYTKPLSGHHVAQMCGYDRLRKSGWFQSIQGRKMFVEIDGPKHLH